MKKLTNGLAVVIVLWLLVAGCGGGGGSGGSDSGGGSGTTGTADLTEFSSEDWQSLLEEEKLALANKANGTLYKGVASLDFFDYAIQSGSQVIIDDSNQIEALEKQLSRSLGDIDAYLELIDEKYSFDSRRKPLQYPLAMLYELPISKELYDAWMAYQLSNTILFSPAVELESCDYIDIQNIFYRLFHMIGEDASISDIVYEHMVSQENWRRFRSPEDNTREMMEIFLAHYVDEDVPVASQACKNWSLTDESDGYRMYIDFDDNTEPLKLLGRTVVDCYDFYDAVAEHSKLIPAVTARLVDIFFPATAIMLKSRLPTVSRPPVPEPLEHCSQKSSFQKNIC